MDTTRRDDPGRSERARTAQIDLALMELARMTREIEELAPRVRDEADRAHLESLEAVRRTLVTIVAERLDVEA